MEFFLGIKYNIKGLSFALKNPSLLILGLLRFVIVIALALAFSGLLFVWHDQILSIIWDVPDNKWLIYLWKGISFIVSLFLVGISMILSYLVAQIFFGVFIMDYMSRITERIILGHESNTIKSSWIEFFFYLIRQEIPRSVIPILISLGAMCIGLLTPLGPVIFILSSISAVSFMAWDNTDLVATRNMEPFKSRFKFFRKHIWFHIGFGICFLIPWFNIVFLSYAPVGATLYAIKQRDMLNLLKNKRNIY